MKKKLFKYIKIFVSIALILSLVAPSYASLSASDGSAFVTKAEFDSALADFNSRLTTFEAGINSKIDSQVTSYLDRNGIWSAKVTTVNNPSFTMKWGAIAPAHNTTGPYCEKFEIKATNYNVYISYYPSHVTNVQQSLVSLSKDIKDGVPCYDNTTIMAGIAPWDFDSNMFDSLPSGGTSGETEWTLDKFVWFKAEKSGLAFLNFDWYQNWGTSSTGLSEFGWCTNYLNGHTYGNVHTFNVSGGIYLDEFRSADLTLGKVSRQGICATQYVPFYDTTNGLVNGKYIAQWGGFARQLQLPCIFTNVNAPLFVTNGNYYIFNPWSKWTSGSQRIMIPQLGSNDWIYRGYLYVANVKADIY